VVKIAKKKSKKTDYKKVLSENVPEAKKKIEKMKDPDYEKLIEIEKKNKDRKGMKEYLKEELKEEKEEDVEEKKKPSKKKEEKKLTKEEMIREKKLRRTKRSMLSKMYMRHLRRIAKEKEIPGERLKVQMIDKLTRELEMKDVRKYYSEIFGTEEFDVLKHDLVPKHKVLSPEEKEELKEKYNLKSLKQLPKMKISDPGVIAVGGVIGDVIEITRNSPTAKETTYYRLVVR
jgi:DNA-directed RNA polymerase subunit H